MIVHNGASHLVDTIMSRYQIQPLSSCLILALVPLDTAFCLSKLCSLVVDDVAKKDDHEESRGEKYAEVDSVAVVPHYWFARVLHSRVEVVVEIRVVMKLCCRG